MKGSPTSERGGENQKYATLCKRLPQPEMSQLRKLWSYYAIISQLFLSRLLITLLQIRVEAANLKDPKAMKIAETKIADDATMQRRMHQAHHRGTKSPKLSVDRVDLNSNEIIAIGDVKIFIERDYKLRQSKDWIFGTSRGYLMFLSALRNLQQQIQHRSEVILELTVTTLSGEDQMAVTAQSTISLP
jgi:hypothetical protein